MKICGSYIQEAKDARNRTIFLQRTAASLECVLHQLREVVQEPCNRKLLTPSSLVNNLNDCLSRLEGLKEKIDPVRGKQMMRRLDIRALKWPLKRAEVDKTIQDLERHKSSFILSCRPVHIIYRNFRGPQKGRLLASQHYYTSYQYKVGIMR